MPHAETMGETMVNGDSPQSQFLAVQHLTSYPMVSDGISTYKSNPYGAKSVELASDAYTKLAGPILPYLKGPYSYVAPYVAKADELGDSGLTTFESRVPIVKEDTEKVKGKITDVIYFPFAVVQGGKQYVFSTYSDESSKIEGKGMIKTAKTVVSTELKIASDVLHAVAEFLGPKKEAAEKKMHEKHHQMHEKLHQMKN